MSNYWYERLGGDYRESQHRNAVMDARTEECRQQLQSIYNAGIADGKTGYRNSSKLYSNPDERAMYEKGHAEASKPIVGSGIRVMQRRRQLPPSEH